MDGWLICNILSVLLVEIYIFMQILFLKNRIFITYLMWISR